MSFFKSPKKTSQRQAPASKQNTDSDSVVLDDVHDHHDVSSNDSDDDDDGSDDGGDGGDSD